MTRERGLILTAGQQRALDEASVRAGTSAETLMESAGQHAAAWVLAHVRPTSAVVLAGPGGNGGDAFVVARCLLEAGTTLCCFTACSEDALSPLTRTMADRLKQAGVDIQIIGTDLTALRCAMDEADCVIDGLFGSGLSRPLEGNYAELVEFLNQANVRIVSLDLPSGLPSDSGSVLGPAVNAAITLAMAYYKPSHWLYPAAECCGGIHLVDVDYPQDLAAALVPVARVPDKEIIQRTLPVRHPAGHKGLFGHVLIVAGSQGMSGAAILCARAALRAGSGLVTLVVPTSILPAVQSAVPEALTISLPDTNRCTRDADVLAKLGAAMEHADVLAIGPGLSRTPAMMTWVREITSTFSGQLVIDADAIHAFVGHLDLLGSLAGSCIMTPHPGEFSALIGSTSHEVDVHRLDRVAEFVARWPLALVLKGRPTVIGLPDESVVVNPTGNTGLATGGSGDVLTGLLAGLLAGGSSIADVAVAGPFIHGLAADRWAVVSSERSLTPSDVIEDLPRILKELES